MTEPKQWIDELKKYQDPTDTSIPNLSVKKMKEDLLWYVIHYDYVSFAELQRRYGDQGNGNQSIFYEANLILWVNLSDSLATAIHQLLEDKEIHLHPASVLTYLVDGCSLRLPLAKRPPAKGYSKEHWIPVCFRSGPFCSSRECPTRIRPKANQKVNSK